MDILRTSRDGCWELRSNGWGQFLAPAADPLADTVITDEQLQGMELHSDIPKIPCDLWQRWIDLCFELVVRGTGDLEVSCRFIRNKETKQYRILIPQQQVTGASVRVDSFDRSVDIETGEVVTQFPPEGWEACGSSHSHNTMKSFFSGTDDKYELGDPGLHIVVGEFDTVRSSYTHLASVTAYKRRFIIDTDSVVDTTWVENQSYNPAVLDVIKLPKPTGLKPIPKAVNYTSAFGRTTALDNYDYGFGFPNNELDTTAIGPELIDLDILLDKITSRSESLGIDTSRLLQKISWDLEDRAWDAHSGATDPLLEDPFYWKA